jgi:hypothetical protein
MNPFTDLGKEDPFKELTDLRDAYQEKIKAYGIDKFKELFTEYFKQYPMVEQVCWEQYTPGFNDGDPCTFDVHEGYILVTKKFALANPEIVKGYNEQEEEDEDSGFKECYGSYPEGPRWFDSYVGSDRASKEGLSFAQKALAALLEVEDVLESVFGDGYGILVTRTEDGVTIVSDEVCHD